VVAALDIEFIDRALFLAERGRGTTAPNPIVGAVVVSDDGVVVGQGAHRVAGAPQAQVFAVDAAGGRARGGTLYCTLEPCCHTGRTGPCAERVVSAGIVRVVAALQDPNPRVAGGGFAYLRDRGVIVETDVARAAAERQNAPFVTWMTRKRPHITMKAATSRDGFAGAESAPVKLTAVAMDRRMHQQRAEVDAIAVGSTTMLVDDPQLTARLVYRHRPLTRVVFDRRGRVPATARLFQTLAAGPVIMFVGADVVASSSSAALRAAGATVVPLPDVDAVLFAVRYLAERDVQSLLLEGGPTLHRAFWDADVVDRVQVIEAPLVLGHGVRAFVPDVAPDRVSRRAHGADVLMEWDVHRPD